MKFDKALVGALLLVPAVVIAGWIASNPYLKSVVPGFSPMNPLTATLFLCIGVAFILNIWQHRYAAWALRFAGWFALLVGVLMLLKYAAGWDLHIDQLMFHDRMGTNRMAPNTAANFVLVGVLLLGYKWRQKPALYILLGLNAFISILSVIGYTYGLKVLFGIAGFNPMAVHTAVCFLLVDLLIIRRLLSIGKLYIDRKIIALLVVSILIIVGSGVATHRAIRLADDQNTAAEHSDLIISQVNQLRTALVSAETGQRGYLLTGQASYLQPYEEAVGEVSGMVALLKNQLHDTSHAATIEQIALLTDGKMAELAETVRLRQAGRTQAALALVNSNRGKQYLDEIQSGLAQIVQNETVNQQRFATAATDDRQRMLWMLATATAVNTVVIITAFVFIQRSIAQRLDAEAQQQAILASLPVGVFVAEVPSGKPLLVNAKAEELLGVNIDKTADKNRYAETYHLELADGTPYPVSELPLVQTLATGKPAKKDDIIVRQPSGHVISMRAASAPIYDSGGQIQRAVVVSQDITQEKELDRAKDGLISLVSHQLRTPATAVKQFIGMVLEEYVGSSKNLSKEQRDMLEQANSSNDELLQLITDILDIARLEAGTTKPQIVPGDLKAALQDLADRQKQLVAEKTQKLVLDMPATAKQVSFDKTLLMTAIDNLVNNASKYSPKGSQVGLSLKFADGHATIAVRDEGPGIAKADLPKLFNRFSRLDPSVNGTGLGLYLVRLVAELHGGRVEVKSHLGKGSTFSIIIPIKRGGK